MALQAGPDNDQLLSAETPVKPPKVADEAHCSIARCTHASRGEATSIGAWKFQADAPRAGAPAR